MAKNDWSLGDHLISDNETAWLIAYYQTIIEDIARTKRRQIEAVYYSMLLYAGLYGVLNYVHQVQNNKTETLIVIAIIAISIYISTLMLTAVYGRDLRRFREISKRFHTVVFPPIVQSVRYGRTITKSGTVKELTPEPNKFLNDLLINFLLFIIPLSGPSFFLYAAINGLKIS